MTIEELPLEQQIFLLKNALVEAHDTVSFLHHRLLNPKISYDYPAKTVASLNEWKKLIGLPKRCHHYYRMSKCEICTERKNTRIKVYKILAKLNKQKLRVVQ